MIEVNGLTKTYGNLYALNNVSFTVPKGQIVGFLGANGAGKTTTMDIICGCLGADDGSVAIDGIDVLESPVQAKRKLGYLPDEPPIYDDMRVVDFVEYAAKLNKVTKDNLSKRVDETIEKLSLGDVKHRVVGNLSKGFRQRVGLAQAIVHNPEVLILDEPTEGLDPNQIVHIRELIQELGGQHTIILSSHILSEVQATCDHIVIINKGEIVTQGTYDELLKSMEGGRQYRVRIAGDREKLIGELKSTNGIAEIKGAEDRSDSVDILLDGGEDLLDHVTKTIVAGDYGLRELASHSKSLEEIFLTLTH